MFLGFAVKMQIRLPEDKLCRIEELILGWEKKKFCTKHELDSLIGQLQPGRSFLCRMIILSKVRHKSWHHIRIVPPLEQIYPGGEHFLGHGMGSP